CCKKIDTASEIVIDRPAEVAGDAGVVGVVGVCGSSGSTKRLFFQICFTGLGDFSCAGVG
ncbi:MAG: hypothetical protein QOJ02_3421, partial [Acidobacteriota bacterium]|nr:hypothetical protein [Acidobacteriota bacterium]